ncbi:lasso peptide biosynthesis B2 protein [Streptomyces sp. NPDC088554]|uniref:lasso peptide biosynthesis B2 protein n=1 Tax=Streptomyces sp. NPDC088554 TaxID=3365865 RepID=UPI0038250AE1
MHDLPRFVTAPRQVRALDFGHVMVLVDYRSNRVQCLFPAAAAHWTAAACTGRLDTVPGGLAAQLLASGFLIPKPAATPWPVPVVAPPSPPSWGGAEHPAGTSRPQAPRGHGTAAAAALASVLAIKTVGHARHAMQRITTALNTTASRCRCPATPAQATAAVLAVRHACWYSPARTACLEESAATVVLLAARRLSVTWCHGVAPDPVRLHAWVETEDGAPVAEPPSTLAYTPALTIGGHHQHQP